MSHAAITHDLQHWYQLSYTPGTWMDDAWWGHLGLASWEGSYRRFASCRPSINRLIRQRLAPSWPALPGILTSQQRALLALEPRLRRLIIALGLVELNCPDHLLLKTHRQALMPLLEPHHCNQLLGLHQDWSSSAIPLATDALANAALYAGTQWFQRDATPCPVTNVLKLHLPPTNAVTVTQPNNAIHWLIKAGRFL